MTKILVIAGSLRKESYNKKTARSIKNIASEEFEVQVFEIDQVPMFNEDLEEELPVTIKNLIKLCEWADGIISVTPEYNNLLPGSTKNVYDWLSRKYAKIYLKNKPLGLVGASDGGFGTARAQVEMVTLSQYLGLRPLMRNRVHISRAQDGKFDDDGMLIDQDIINELKNLLEAIKNFN